MKNVIIKRDRYLGSSLIRTPRLVSRDARRRRIMRDSSDVTAIPAAPPSSQADDVGALGWLGEALKNMVATSRWVYGITDGTAIITASGFPIRLMDTTMSSIIDNLRIQAAGSAGKAITTHTMTAGEVAAGTTVGVGALGLKCFGVKIRIAASPVNFKFGTYQVQLIDAGNGNAVIATVYVEPIRVPVELVMLGISDAGGVATPLGIASPNLNILTPSSMGWAAGDTVALESLTLRDLGEVQDLA